MPRHNVGHFKGERARAHFLSVYQTAVAELPQVSESTDVRTSFGTVRAYRFDGPSAGPPVVLLPGRNASAPMWRVNIPALLASLWPAWRAAKTEPLALLQAGRAAA